jgi:hypothetical protein
MQEREISTPDDMRDEYDLDQLPVRRIGPDRKDFGRLVQLDEDVVALFPSSESVNEALRLLTRILRENVPA